MRRAIPSITRDQRGAAAVEFAIVAVPLCVVLLGALDVGYQSYLRSTLQGDLYDVARIASVENPKLNTSGNTLQERVEAAIKQRIAPLASKGTYTIKAQSYSDFSKIGKPEPLVTDKNNDGKYDLGDCWQDMNGNGGFDTDAGKSGLGGASDVVFYEVQLKTPRLVPMDKLIGLPGYHEARAKVAIRTQPYADQQQPKVVCSCPRSSRTAA